MLVCRIKCQQQKQQGKILTIKLFGISVRIYIALEHETNANDDDEKTPTKSSKYAIEKWKR